MCFISWSVSARVKKKLLEMSSCDSSGEDFMGRRLRQLQQDYNQRKYIGWATEEEIAARQVEMERSVRKEFKIVTAQQEGGPSNPVMVGFVQPQYDLSLKLSGTTPSLEDPQRPSTVFEAYRVTNQFFEDFRVLKAQVEILEAENQCLRRIIRDLKNQQEEE